MQDESYPAARIARIPLFTRQGIEAYALVDVADYERLAQFRWNIKRGRNGALYAVRFAGRRPRLTIQMARDVLGVLSGSGTVVDHINRNTLDNRRQNLREVTWAENQQNRSSAGNRTYAKKAPTSRYRGVRWKRDARKWAARVTVDNKEIHLGYFDDELEAARAAAEARAELMPLSVEAMQRRSAA